ncbi:DUF2346 domain-containing protein [Vibrio viridaestus]|uniref:DUF2346 domain-containing protein n=1 Tax=Vibrio viridaestus TaxID=2487322 RepID=A0A3N9TDK5_9VIBR|nr:DUF2346 domain-containing protein [Vibrio viridaestus]
MLRRIVIFPVGIFIYYQESKMLAKYFLNKKIFFPPVQFIDLNGVNEGKRRVIMAPIIQI